MKVSKRITKVENLKKITEVETFLHPTDFFHYLKHLAQTEASELFFKESGLSYNLGQLAFGTTNYRGHLVVKDCGKGTEEGRRKLILSFDNRPLPKEVKEEIIRMIFIALNKMAKRNGNYLFSFTLR